MGLLLLFLQTWTQAFSLPYIVPPQVLFYHLSHSFLIPRSPTLLSLPTFHLLEVMLFLSVLDFCIGTLPKGFSLPLTQAVPLWNWGGRHAVLSGNVRTRTTRTEQRGNLGSGVAPGLSPPAEWPWRRACRTEFPHLQNRTLVSLLWGCRESEMRSCLCLESYLWYHELSSESSPAQ